MTDHAIRIRGLRKRYRGFTLKDVDLDVPRGYVTGLIGPNGAGKTTLIKLIMNLVRRDAGTITVLGLDNLADEVAVKSRIGFIYDEPPFYHDVSLARLGPRDRAVLPGAGATGASASWPIGSACRSASASRRCRTG